jgi:prefoldin alpha subunit
MVELNAEDALKLIRMDEERLRILENQKQALNNAMQEIQSARLSLQDFPKKQQEAIFSLGAGNFTTAKIGGDKLLVSLGNNVVMEKTVEDALETLDKREESIKEELGKINESQNRIRKRAENVSQKLRDYMQSQKGDSDSDVPLIG